MYQNPCVNVKTVLGEWEKALLLSVTLTTSATSAAKNLPPNNTRMTSALVSCSGRVLQDTFSVYSHPSIYHHLTRICQFDLSGITYNERPVVLAVGIAHTYALNPADTSNFC